MSRSAIYLINKYLSSDDYKSEAWYLNLNEKDKEFIKSLDKAVEKGIVKGINEYKRGEQRK